jgi:alkylresorcinol/alkylpyrone synthase
MFISAIGTATPANRYTQRECWEAYCVSPYLERLSSRSHAILRKVLGSDNGIETRHFVLSDLREAFSYDANMLHRRFADNAPALAAQAARQALDRAGVTAQEIDALIICTCTGYLCPGLTSYVSELLGLRSSSYLADLVGHGCGAALPNLQLARALLDSGQARRVLSICVEICSAAFYVDNDPGVLISTCLFGDGAAAVVLSNDPPKNARSARVLKFASVLNPKDRDLLRFETRDGMLRNILDKSVPVLVVDHVREVLNRLAPRSGATAGRAAVAEWILHAGGRDVLLALQSGIGIPEGKLHWSAEVLKQNGNISSPSVLFALEKALSVQSAPGTWFLSSFGAGISCHGALLEVGE